MYDVYGLLYTVVYLPLLTTRRASLRRLHVAPHWLAGHGDTLVRCLSNAELADLPANIQITLTEGFLPWAEALWNEWKYHIFVLFQCHENVGFDSTLEVHRQCPRPTRYVKGNVIDFVNRLLSRHVYIFITDGIYLTKQHDNWGTVKYQ